MLAFHAGTFYPCATGDRGGFCAARAPKIPVWEQQLSAAAVSFNLELAALALGFDVQWQTDWVAYDDGARAAIGAAPSEQVAGIIYIGKTTVPLEDRPRPELSKLGHPLERVMAIKGILFDKDGTLIEVNGTWIPVYKAMLSDVFGHSMGEIVEFLERAGYDPSSGHIKAGSIMASGTTRELVQVWWPELNADQQRQRVHLIDNDLAPKALSYVTPLMDLQPVFDELHAMGLIIGRWHQ